MCNREEFGKLKFLSGTRARSKIECFENGWEICRVISDGGFAKWKQSKLLDEGLRRSFREMSPRSFLGARMRMRKLGGLGGLACGGAALVLLPFCLGTPYSVPSSGSFSISLGYGRAT